MVGFLKRLTADRQGATIVEFALVLPPLLLTLMGLFDMAHNMYTAQILNGAIQQLKAPRARDRRLMQR